MPKSYVVGFKYTSDAFARVIYSGIIHSDAQVSFLFFFVHFVVAIPQPEKCIGSELSLGKICKYQKFSKEFPHGFI